MSALKVFLGFQLLATLATAVTLLIAPGFIPAQSGVLLPPSGFMVAYLFAAAELTCAIGSATAIAARDGRTVLAVAIGSTLYQFLVGLAGFYGAVREGIPAMLPNVLLHAVIVAGFLVLISRARKPAAQHDRVAR